MEAATPSRAEQINVGSVLEETFSIYRANWVALLGSAIVVFAVVGLVAGLLQSVGGIVLGLLAGIVRLAGYALFTGFVVRLVQDVRDGRRDESVGDLFAAAAPSIVALILFGILFGLGVGIGFLLLIVPGLFLLTFWSLGAPAIVVEDEDPVGAFGRSWRLVSGNGWSVFGVLFAVLLIVLAFQLILTAIAVPIGTAAVVLAAILSAAATAPVFALAVSVMFFDLGGGAGQTTPTATEPPPA